MFSLELHSTHDDKPEEVCVFVVSAGDDLVVDERMLNFLIVSVFPFMVSNQNEGRVEPSQEVAQQKVQQVFIVV